jgi:hypothetical protein
MATNIPLSERLRSTNGQFRAAMKDVGEQSVSDKIILEEFEKFINAVDTRLVDECDTWTAEDTLEFQQDGKKQVKKMLSSLLGGPLARFATGIIRGPSSWNGYQADNFATKHAELVMDIQGEDADEENGSYPFGS